MLIKTLALIAFVATSFIGGCDSPKPDTNSTDPAPVTSASDSSTSDAPKTNEYDSSLADKTMGESKGGTAASQEPKSGVEDRKPKDGDEVAVMDTEKGKIILMFFPDKAPNHVKNFIKLAKSGFYDGTKFHRTIPGFMIQGGDPNTKTSNRQSWGTGGSKENVKAEFNDVHHSIGILSMARSSDPDSASSQFFIMVGDSPQLDGQYSAFGKVVSGQDVADTIVALPTDGDIAVNPVAIKSVKIEKWPLK